MDFTFEIERKYYFACTTLEHAFSLENMNTVSTLYTLYDH